MRDAGVMAGGPAVSATCLQFRVVRSALDVLAGGRMSQAVAAFTAVEELAGYVHAVLCEKDALDPAQAPLFRTPLRRGGRVCGVVFHVEGPRLLRTSAVWSGDDARIIFYDSSGLRFREVDLSESPVTGEPGA
jgi:hypothetical protein